MPSVPHKLPDPDRGVIAAGCTMNSAGGALLRVQNSLPASADFAFTATGTAMMEATFTGYVRDPFIHPASFIGYASNCPARGSSPRRAALLCPQRPETPQFLQKHVCAATSPPSPSSLRRAAVRFSVGSLATVGLAQVLVFTMHESSGTGAQRRPRSSGYRVVFI